MKIDFTCEECGAWSDDYYSVFDDIWLSVMPGRKGHLHIACLEKRLGRQLELEDFPDYPINRNIKVGYNIAMRHR